ncbi:hepatic and glial cell adhesion molecule-like [Latimeria chalumnae]|uniref:hepatic and glial cell adhesion molecule-like n=1 Tax=Latimeria chalumnae TaxID=7897 RepID=UPI00313B44D1
MLFNIILAPVSGINISANIETPEIQLGQSLMLNCSVTRGSSPSFTWYHNGQKIQAPQDHYRLSQRGDSLIIDSARLDHGGSYQCTAENQFSNFRRFNLTSGTVVVIVLEQSFLTQTLSISFSLVLLLILIPVIFLAYFRHQRKTDLRLPSAEPRDPSGQGGQAREYREGNQSVQFDEYANCHFRNQVDTLGGSTKQVLYAEIVTKDATKDRHNRATRPRSVL